MMALTFPGGTLKTVEVTATAGNVVSDSTPGSGKRWKILYGNFVLTTSGDSANRTFRVQILSGSDVLCNLGASSENIPASTTGTLDFGGLMNANNRNFTNGAYAGYPQFFSLDPESFIIEGSDILRITINNGVVGDSYEGFIRVLEFGL